jgi:hypothetical protein
MNRIPRALAGLALVAIAAAGCGDDEGDSPTATDPTTSGSVSPSASATESPSVTVSSPSGGMTDNSDPVPSPIIDKAVKAAIRDDFPALVPAGVPAGWTVVSATYHANGGGVWQITLDDPKGNPVSLRQSTADIASQMAQLPAAEAAGTVDLSAYGTGTWKVYTGDGIAVLAKKLSGTSAVVSGPDEDTVVTLAQELLTAEDSGSADGG